MKLRNAFKRDVLIVFVICLIVSLIYAVQGDKMTAIYYMCISIVLFLIQKFS